MYQRGLRQRNKGTSFYTRWFVGLAVGICVSALLVACGAPLDGTGGSGSTDNGATATATQSAATATSTSVATATATASAPVTQPTASTVPSPVLASIRMIDTSNGWALSKSAVLKTSDGGRHWRNVLPQGKSLGANAYGEFLTSRNAWVAWQEQQQPTTSQTITVITTSDGGANWHTVTIPNVPGGLVDAPRFINLQRGWLVATQAEGMMQYSVTTYQTMDGGQSWARVGQARTTQLNGVSFLNAQLGWAGVEWPGDAVSVQKTTNGGQSWTQVTLPAPQGVSDPQSIGNTLTTPPVLFGATGLLPAHITFGAQPTTHLVIYTTHNSGTSWSSGALANFDSKNVYVLDRQHIWAGDANSSALYFSRDGASWTKLTNAPERLGELSFVSSSNGWAIGSSSGHLYHTSDGGASWQAL